MGIKAARKARDIIDNHHRLVGLVCFEPVEHRHHTRTISDTAAHIVGKDLSDLIALIPGIFPATGFL